MNKYSYPAMLAFFLLFSINTAWSETTSYKEITAPEVKSMLDSNEAVLINLLSKIEFDMQNIPGSINIPLDVIDSSDKMPGDKNKPIILHCMGKQWHITPTGASLAVKRGYTNVYAFVGGIPEWRSFNYPMNVNEKLLNTKVNKMSPKNVEELIKSDPSVFVLDVRPRNFPEQTYIKGTSRIHMHELPQRINEIPKDRSIIITDGFGKQSPIAGKFLITQGYNVIGALKGGLGRWLDEGLPVEDLNKWGE